MRICWFGKTKPLNSNRGKHLRSLEHTEKFKVQVMSRTAFDAHFFFFLVYNPHFLFRNILQQQWVILGCTYGNTATQSAERHSHNFVVICRCPCTETKVATFVENNAKICPWEQEWHKMKLAGSESEDERCMSSFLYVMAKKMSKKSKK
jgi:hypothetical protein